MGLSTNTYPYTGGDQVFPVSFALGYLSRDDIQVRVNNETVADEPLYRDFIWVDDNNIRIPSQMQVGDLVTIQRTVSAEDLFVSFMDGDDITKYNLDAQARQAIMLYQEFADGRSDIAGFNSLVEQLKIAVDKQIASTESNADILDAINRQYDGQPLISTIDNLTQLSNATINPLYRRIAVGNATYQRVSDNPGHMYSGQDSEGQWWEINEQQYISTMALDPEDVPEEYRRFERVQIPAGSVFGREDTVNVLASIARNQDRPYVHVETFDVRVRYDPIAEAFSLPDDDEQIFAEVRESWRTQATLDLYRPARRNHNALAKAMRWAMGTFSLRQGNTILYYQTADFRTQPDKTLRAHSAIPVFGKHRIGDGNGQKLFMESAGVTNTIQNVTFTKLSNDPRNEPGQDAIYRATVTYANRWDDILVVGKSVANRGVSGHTRADDGVSVINGAYEVLTISSDRRTLTFDVWNPREQTAGADPVPLPLNPTIGQPASEDAEGNVIPATWITSGGIIPNNALVVDCQISPVGGWNGKGFEGYISFERGAMFRWRSIGMVDKTTIEDNELWDSANPTGFTGDRKLMFLGHDCHGVLEANCTFAGGEGAAIRTYGGNTLYSIHTVMGSLCRNHLTHVGYRIQQNTTGQLIRTTTTGYTSRGMELGNSCTFSIHACNFYACNYGVYAILFSTISTNSATILYCNRGIYSQGGVEMTVGTRVYSCQWGLSWDGGEFRGSPAFSGNVFDTLGGVGPGVYYRGGWWRNIPSLRPPVPNIYASGGRITGRTIAFNSDITLDTEVTDRYRFTFAESRQLDFNVLITPRDEAVVKVKFEYVGTTGFDVFLYNAAGEVIDADFSFNVLNIRDV